MKIGKFSIVAFILFILTLVVTAGLYAMPRLSGDIYHRVFAVRNELLQPNAMPSHMIEGYREAKSIVDAADLRKEHVTRLDVLSTAFKAEAASLKQLLDKKQTETNDKKITEQFWREVDTRFLPAVKKSDQSEIVASFERLTALYTTASLFIVKSARAVSERIESFWIPESDFL